MIKQAIVVIILSVLLAALNAWVNPKQIPWSPDVVGEGEISMSDALEEQERAGVYWVDARERKDYEKEHIPGAVLLNEDAWEDLLGDFLDNWDGEQLIVIYCHSGGCQASHDVADRIREELQIENIKVLHRGWAPGWR